MTAPTVAQIRAYVPGGLSQIADPEVAAALAAETVAQANAIAPRPEDEAEPPADLREALMRRVVRNLAMRGLPLGVQSDEMGGIRLGPNDPEVRRLEGPYRRRTVG